MNRRSGLAAAVIATAGVALGFAFALRSSEPGVPRPLTASTYAGGLSVSIPRGFRNYPLHGDVQAPG